MNAKSIARFLAAALSAFSACAALGDTAYSESQRATPESPFMQRLLQQPLEHAAVPETAALLRASRHEQDARQLILAERRRILAGLAGEPFKARTVGEAIAQQSPTSDSTDIMALATARAEVRDPGRGVRRSSAVPEGYRPIGAGIWMQELPTHRMIQMLYVVRNGLRAPITRVELNFEGPETRPGYIDNVKLDCKPDAAEAFAPDVAQAAICEGPLGSTAEANLAALTKRSAPMSVQSVSSPELEDAFKWEYHADLALDSKARETVMKLPCDQKGTCAAIGAAQARDNAKQNAHWTVLNLAALAALIALGVAFAVRPGGNAGWPLTALAVVVVVCALLGVAAMWTTVRPAASYEAFITFAFLRYGAIPYLIGLALLVLGVVSGNTRRVQTFGATFGVLVSASLLWTWKMVTTG